MQQNNLTVKGVSDDLRAFRVELRASGGGEYLTLLQLNVWRPIFDIVVDWLVIAFAVVFVLEFGWWFAPCAVLVIANRQRALGNILHDAGHRNLHRSHWVNDTLAMALVAPLLFVDLLAYRDSHFRHHLRLGSDADPDKLARPPVGSWLKHYGTHLLTASLWWESAFGHIKGTARVSVLRRLYILGWWAVAYSLLWLHFGSSCLATFLTLWMLSRTTVFHAITIFREMCDHYGLVEGGVFSYTRDIVKKSIWRHLVHPRNNGYHLIHHLLPAVPYYKLEEAQRLFSRTPTYREQSHVCDSYVFGLAPVVRRWHSEE
ncbi:fatty acid desaturase family protein [Ralstonia chuxiongensis]|uniref:fatty acid desaturase family protein n=1 Tax=Ralstonia chuxiongensis TaxID=2957504 RepID=UPI0029315FCC|nr:fatty acid desaturase family protein [Ralstonia chuxiongensis]